MDMKTLINLFSIRSASILITFLCIGFLLSCSGGGGGLEINFSGGGFQNRNFEFTVEKVFEEEFQVENHTRVNIEAFDGQIVVTGDGETDRVVVTAYLSVGSDSQEDAEMHLDDLEIQVTDNANEILIQTVQPVNSEGRKYLVEYDVIVPSSFEVMTTQDNGSIDILNIENSVDVSNTNGDVLLYSIVGGVTAGVDNGNIESTVFLPVDKTIDLHTNNGCIELNIPTSASAEFSAAVDGNGEIVVSDLNITDAVKTKQSLTGVIGNGEGSIELSLTNGNIEVIGFN